MSCLFELQFLTPRVKSKRNRKQLQNTQKKKLSCRLQLYHTSQRHAPVLPAHTPKKKNKSKTGKNTRNRRKTTRKCLSDLNAGNSRRPPPFPVPSQTPFRCPYPFHRPLLLIRFARLLSRLALRANILRVFALVPSLPQPLLEWTACSTNLCRLSLGWA